MFSLPLTSTPKTAELIELVDLTKDVRFSNSHKMGSSTSMAPRRIPSPPLLNDSPVSVESVLSDSGTDDDDIDSDSDSDSDSKAGLTGNIAYIHSLQAIFSQASSSIDAVCYTISHPDSRQLNQPSSIRKPLLARFFYTSGRQAGWWF
ncbi:hypothetical protein GQ42DRAFT_157292 [Ramicandelaber brevisporus]|nr:hypothetical protein GQ42DRAFT_157292 [Ramicandelaber brevisporus]